MYSMYFPREANTHCHDLPFEKSIVYTSPMSSTRKMGVFLDGVLYYYQILYDRENGKKT